MRNRHEAAFTSVSELNRACENRPIVFFGAGPIAIKTFRILGKAPLHSIVDNASNLWGKSALGVDILEPDSVSNIKDVFVIICTTSFSQVMKQLTGYGLKNGTDFCVSPILNDLKVIDDLENISKKMLFTNGSPKNDSPKYGGGIYELSVKGDEWSHQKVISGNCYGLIEFEDNYISVDTERGIFEFNANYDIIRSKLLPSGMRAHGVQYSKKHERFYVVGSYRDAILVLDRNFDILDEIRLSYKRERFGSPKHHCNDCLVVEDSLFVSMFSMTGNYQNDVFDGGIVEFDLVTKEKVGVIAQNLWMPHNIQIINGSIHLLNSLRGELLTNNLQVVGQFPAFTRGLDYDGMYYYIGQSRNRNYSKNMGVSKNISVDAGIIVFDEQTKVSRFLQMPPKISEIHSILLLN
jgi:hypothetical protein